jgi:hypothetical protein
VVDIAAATDQGNGLINTVERLGLRWFEADDAWIGNFRGWLKEVAA